MLRITLHDGEQVVRLQIEGTLVGVWVNELETTWRSACAGLKGRLLCVDLTGTTRVDAAGFRLLTLMHQNGAQFLASGLSMKVLVSEIMGGGTAS